MCRYADFRACGCRHCRERFARDYGHALPPLSDKSFWGDTSKPPAQWGNYESAAFRDWVEMRYRTHADHLAMIRRVIGPERMLMTCCASSGPTRLNSMGLSYEHFIASCDWVMLENCGLSAGTVRWLRVEPSAMLHKAVAESKRPGPPAPSVACSYTVFDDSAYLGWAVSQFWGVENWISTLIQKLSDEAADFKEEAELIGWLNRWEQAHELDEGRDVVDVRLGFLRSAKERGWHDAEGRDHWARVARWAVALSKANVGYRFVLTDELADAGRLAAERSPLVLDGCATLSAAQRSAIETLARSGVKLIVVRPCSLEGGSENVVTLDAGGGPIALDSLIAEGVIVPRVRQVDGDPRWRLRLRTHGDRLVLHLLDDALEGIEHPTVLDRALRQKVLHTIRQRAANGPLVVEVDTAGLKMTMGKTAKLYAPELAAGRPVGMERIAEQRFRLTVDLSGTRFYAQVRGG
jgi:hypothetical protein